MNPNDLFRNWLTYTPDSNRRETLAHHLQESADSAAASLAASLGQIAPSPNPEQAALLLTDFFERGPSSPLIERLLLPEILGQVTLLYAASRVLGYFLNLNPGLLETVFPIAKEDPSDFESRMKSGAAEAGSEDPLRRIRLLRSTEYVRILVADVTGLDKLEVTAAKISSLADACFALAMRAAGLDDSRSSVGCQAPGGRDRGIGQDVRKTLNPTAAARGGDHAVGLEGQGVAVIGMGKWGGRELNYSSDIDLFFVCGDAVSAAELPALEEKARRAVALIEEFTEGGQAWRVDTKIRPEGSGPLVRTLASARIYYETRAASWEMQALLKARCVAGDAAVGQAFMDLTRPLVWRRDRDAGSLLAEVRAMKGQIETGLAQKNRELGNVKLGPGGIRDIEFITQFLQLHHGPSNENLRAGDTLTALERLRVHDILTAEEHRHLSAEYAFLRRVEHFLQVDGLESIRQLPVDEARLDVLGRLLGFPDARGLREAFERSVRMVRPIFIEIFDASIDFLGKKEAVRTLLHARPGAVTAQVDEAVDFHFTRLPSDYFLAFRPQEIIRHLALLASLGADTPCRVEAHAEGDRWRITLTAFDAPGLFSKICGVASLCGLSIVSGESFTAARKAPPPVRAADAFYRRQGIFTRPPSAATGLESRNPVLTTLLVENLSGAVAPDLEAMRRELGHFLGLLYSDRGEEANREIELRALERLRQTGRGAPDFSRLRIAIDNDSDRQYTVLEIEGPDAYMFLFEFTHILAERGYSLWKIRIETRESLVRDRLFLTTQKGAKVEAGYRLDELLLTITLIRDFASYLPLAPDPELALRQLGELLSIAQSRNVRVEDPATLQSLARILGSSASLWEDLFRRSPDRLLPILLQTGRGVSVERAAMEARLEEKLSPLASAPLEARFGELAAFRDEEMFRIDIRHLEENGADFIGFSSALADLADLLVSRAVDTAVREEPAARGVPWALFAFGKWGGRELGYASDIEFILVYDGAEACGFAFSRAVRTLLDRLPSPRPGIFEMDLRLRPDGDKGPLAVPFQRLGSYYRCGGEAASFERQACTRVRPIAGDPQLLERGLDAFLDFVYDPTPYDLTEMRRLRGRQMKELVAPGKTNVKYSAGGLVDLEYAVQCAQMRAGGLMRRRHTPNLPDAMRTLAELGLLEPATARTLARHYRFLRDLIDALRIVRGHAKDLILPDAASLEFRYLERRMDALRPEGGRLPLGEEITTRMKESRAIFDDLTQ